jgi:hypothetical protein
VLGIAKVEEGRRKRNEHKPWCRTLMLFKEQMEKSEGRVCFHRKDSRWRSGVPLTEPNSPDII